MKLFYCESKLKIFFFVWVGGGGRGGRGARVSDFFLQTIQFRIKNFSYFFFFFFFKFFFFFVGWGGGGSGGERGRLE